MNAGVLILRVVVGSLLAGHGLQKLLGWFGGPGLATLAQGFDRMGYRPGWLMARLAAVGETVGGVLLVLGLLTPLAVFACVGTMANAVATHWPKVWASTGGYELALTFATVAAAVGLVGPGRYSLDHAFGWSLYGDAWGSAAIGAALVAAAGPILIRAHHRRGMVVAAAPAAPAV
jgi:putative oxidoreductase